jgi:hypothetical protein
MRGLATGFPIVRPRSAPILLLASALLPATKRLTGIPLPWSRLRPCTMIRALDQAVCTCLATARTNPTSSRAPPASGGAPSSGSAPSKQSLALLATTAQAGTVLSCRSSAGVDMSRLSRPHVANTAVAGLGDGAILSRRSLAWHQTEVTHKLTWALKTAHVTDLGRECHCDDQIDAAQCLKRPHERLQRPGQDELFDRARLSRSTRSLATRTASTISCSAI